MRPRHEQNFLGDWLDRKGISRNDFADTLGIPRTHLDRLCRGARNPGLDVALHIEEATNNEITVKMWRQEPTLKEKAAAAASHAKPKSTKPTAPKRK